MNLSAPSCSRYPQPGNGSLALRVHLGQTLTAEQNTLPVATPAPIVTPATNQPPRILPSPIAAETPDSSIPKDIAVHASPVDRLAIGVSDVTRRLPKIIGQGVQGDPKFTFANQMLLARTVPYTLGGASLAAVYAMAGGSKRPVLNAAAGVGLYMAAQFVGSRLVREAFHARTGLDLNQLYQVADKPGQVPAYNRMYASVAWPRVDLIPDKATASDPRNQQTLEALSDRWNIPDDVNDPKGAVTKQIKRLIGQSRFAEMVVGNLAAAVGAGYIGKSQAWAAFEDLPDLLMGPGRGHLGQRVGGLMDGMVSRLGAVAQDLVPSSQAPWGKKAAFALAVGSQLASVLYAGNLIANLPGRPHYKTAEPAPALEGKA